MTNQQGDSASESTRAQTPRNTLEELKRRMNNAQRIVVDTSGRLHVPEDPQVATKPTQEKTVVKPQRWFGDHEPWYETNPARLLLEKNAMQDRFPGFQLVRDPETRRLAWKGVLETNLHNRYEIALIYPDDFPARPPDAFPVSPIIEVWRDEQHRALQHQYRDGRLCLYYPGDHSFTPNTTAAKVMAITAAWLFAYESWLASGKTDWPGIEAD